MRTLVVGGGSPSLGRSNCPFLLGFLSISIDRYREPGILHTCVYPCNNNPSGKPTTDDQMTAPGVSDTSPATCFFCTCPVRHCRKKREKYSTLIYCIMECLAGPYNDGRKTTLNCESMQCTYCMPVKHTTMQCTTKQQSGTKYQIHIICRIYTRHVM